MGVSGTGKSTVAEGLSRRLGWELVEGDDLHPAANVAKMAAGTPLTDEDRRPWLDRVNAVLAEHAEAGRGCVATCSALRRVYRDRLRDGVPDVLPVLLTAPVDELRRRVSHRPDHFMPASLLDSQLATLEPLEDDEDGVVLDVTGPPPAVLDAAVRLVAQRAVRPRP
ncbi:gluconokinase [Nocardioides sp. GY 10127]|nr:gluconokinase [Nocardioides sp. GY 10127]